MTVHPNRFRVSSEKDHNSDVGVGWDKWGYQKLKKKSEDTKDISGQAGPLLSADLHTVFLAPLATLTFREEIK